MGVGVGVGMGATRCLPLYLKETIWVSQVCVRRLIVFVCGFVRAHARKGGLNKNLRVENGARWKQECWVKCHFGDRSRVDNPATHTYLSQKKMKSCWCRPQKDHQFSRVFTHRNITDMSFCILALPVYIQIYNVMCYVSSMHVCVRARVLCGWVYVCICVYLYVCC